MLALGMSASLYADAQNSSSQDACPYKSMREAIDTISARESAHEWQKIQWRTNAKTALVEAQKQSKPIFVFFVVKQKVSSPKNWVGDKNDMGKTGLGGRLMQGSSLSDSKIIGLLNSKFIPLYADVDAYGFPEEITAIKKYKFVWKAFSKNKWGIATSAVVDSSGKRLLAESGSGFFWEWKTATNYYPDRFLSYLQKALSKNS